MAWVGVDGFREGVQGCAQGLSMARVRAGKNALEERLPRSRVSRVMVELKLERDELGAASVVARVDEF